MPRMKPWMPVSRRSRSLQTQRKSLCLAGFRSNSRLGSPSSILTTKRSRHPLVRREQPGETGHVGLDVRDSVDSYIAFQLAELEGCLPLVGAADQDAVHGARLALGRLRSVLSCYKSVLPDIPQATGRDVRWLARSLGEARDAYVLSQRLTLWLDVSEAWLSPEALHEAVNQLLASSNIMATRVGTGRRWQGIVRGTRQALLPATAHMAAQEIDHHPSLLEVAELLQPRWETVQKSLEAAQRSLETDSPQADEAERK